MTGSQGHAIISIGSGEGRGRKRKGKHIMATIAEAIYHMIEQLDGEKGKLKLVGYRKAQAIKVWLLDRIR